MFSRMIEADYPHSFLDTQYRMHETLMQVPNRLFYEGLIQCGYVPDRQKMFMFSRRPFLFVDVKNGREKVKGTSFANFEEVEVTDALVDLCLQ